MCKTCWLWIFLEFQEEKLKRKLIRQDLFKTYYKKINAYKLLPKIMIIPLYCKMFRHSYKNIFVNIMNNAWCYLLALDIHQPFRRNYINTLAIKNIVDLFIKFIRIFLNYDFPVPIFRCSSVLNKILPF